VPEHFVQAIGLITPAVDAEGLAPVLSTQLSQTVAEFPQAVDNYGHTVTHAEWQQLDVLQREVLGPLTHVPRDRPIRRVIDALDQLAQTAVEGVYSALDQLSEGAEWPHVRLVVTARRETRLPKGAQVVSVDAFAAGDAEIEAYLARRGVAVDAQRMITQASGGSWLIARLAADVAQPQGHARLEDLAELYDKVLGSLGATPQNPRWRGELRPVFAVLAVSGVNATLPLPLLCAASEKLDGAKTIAQMRNLLADLHRYINRAAPGTPEERVGLFHATLAAYLLDENKGRFNIDGMQARKALVEAISALAPAEQHDPDDLLHQ